MIQKAVGVVFISFISFGLCAQWYSNKYGVENITDLSDAQLMESYSNARTTAIVGIPLTFVGAGLMVGGIVYATASAAMYIVTLGTVEPESYGGGIFILGTVVTVVGTTLWIMGGARKKQLSPTIWSRDLISDISISPGVGYERITDTCYPTLTLRIGF